MHQLGGDGTVDSSTDGSDNTTFWTANLADALNFLSDELFLFQNRSADE
jgi:hypothetical protein